jgi:DNA-binding transcriptional MerR regulator
VELTGEELLRRLHVTRAELQAWLDNDLLAPVPGAGDRFPATAVEEGELIRTFAALGYALAEIHRIKRSVGLPVKDETGRFVSRSDFLTVGELAEKSGINVRTIKFWEEKGLIAPYRRTEGGFRLYRQGDVAFLSFIRDLQAFNYSLAEIATIVKLVGSDLGAAEAGLERLPPAEVEKAASALEFLVGRMQEVREASLRVEAVFSRRLRAVARRLRAGKRGS